MRFAALTQAKYYILSASVSLLFSEFTAVRLREDAGPTYRERTHIGPPGAV
jgi:hypothetical protein